MQKEYVIQFYKTINKLLCNLSFVGQYNYVQYQNVAVLKDLLKEIVLTHNTTNPILLKLEFVLLLVC